jgi:8-oxo-dGTP diphosphatase
MIETPRHSVSVAAAIVAPDGRMLATKRCDTGAWELPGGVLELDETFTDGVIREVREETGLTVEPERLSGVYKHMNAGIVALVFRCRVVDGHVSPTAEADEIAWLTPGEIQEHMTEAFAIRLLDALDNSGSEPHVRVHDGRHVIA